MTTDTKELPNDVKDCITACWDCRAHIQNVFFTHCLEKGGNHVAPEHVKIMVDCMEICQTAADFMTRNSTVYASVCAACAEICYHCADSCEEIDDEEMIACAQLCRECAEMCDDLSLSSVIDSSGKSIESNITMI